MASLPNAAARAAVIDFNGDGHPDYVLQNANTRQTAIWYLNNNIYQGGAFGPSITVGWVLEGVADFNRDSSSGLRTVQSRYRSNRDLVYVRANTHRSRVRANAS